MSPVKFEQVVSPVPKSTSWMQIEVDDCDRAMDVERQNNAVQRNERNVVFMGIMGLMITYPVEGVEQSANIG